MKPLLLVSASSLLKLPEVIHQILQALRMFCKGCYQISMVLAILMDKRKRLEYNTSTSSQGRSLGTRLTIRVDAFNFENGGKISVFKKNIRIRVDGALFTESD